jgi:myo-inositol-1(or 4)-monophosphatase
MMDKFLKVAIHAAESSGKIVLDYFEKLHDFTQKTENMRDLVTEVDLLSERCIKKKIKRSFPNHSIIGEESGADNRNSDYMWHIDPLDGTVNYSQGIPLCVVSIALEKCGEIIMGVIFNPFAEEMFFASKGNGAFLNGKSIHVSTKKSIEEGLFVAAFSALHSKAKMKEYEIFGKINDISRGALRLGSAALALAFVACGRLDGFWAKDLFSWDIAAGVVLVIEAGGKVSTVEGSSFILDGTSLVATNENIHNGFLEITKEIMVV